MPKVICCQVFTWAFLW